MDDRFTDKHVSINEALDELATGLVELDKSYHIGSFFEFMRDTWSKGYDKPELFNVWHIEKVCNEFEKAWDDKKNLCVVMPRFHFKSTIGYAWTMYRQLKRKRGTQMYISYKDGMSRYHTGEIKKAILNNPELNSIFIDRTPQSESLVRYQVGKAAKHRTKIVNGGVFSFKRGLHADNGIVVDDILRDPDNPLNFTQLNKIEEHFFAEIMFIPNPGSNLVVLGTPMAPDDLLLKLKNDDRFNYVFLPAVDPDENHHILFPALYSEEWLFRQKGKTPAQQKAFASEMMLTPYLLSQSFIQTDEIDNVCSPALKSHSIYTQREPEDEGSLIVAGFDVGKKRHPSHLTVLEVINGIGKEVHQSFLDGMGYTDQCIYLEDACSNLKIDRLYIDGTRGELEDRKIPEQSTLIIFTERKNRQMATLVERIIQGEYIELINDERRKSQIACVDINLKAPETPAGHGEAFWSLGLALLAWDDIIPISDIEKAVGNLQELKPSDDEEKDELKDKIMKSLYGQHNLDSYNITSCPSCKSNVGVELRKLSNVRTVHIEEAELLFCMICDKSWKVEKGRIILEETEED